jgi:hypothetical protein
MSDSGQVVAVIAAVFIAPGAATIAFLLSPFARRKRVAAWLLLPVIYCAVAVIAVVVAVNLGFMEPP